MKAEELMIGDWVLYEGKPIIVENVYDDCINYTPDIPYVQEEYFIKVNNIQPIPITEEIMEKNEFTCDSNVGKIHERNDTKGIEWDATYSFFTGMLKLRNKKAYPEPHKIVVSCFYIHELQHALRLCGIEKEIIL